MNKLLGLFFLIFCSSVLGQLAPIAVHDNSVSFATNLLVDNESQRINLDNTNLNSSDLAITLAALFINAKTGVDGLVSSFDERDSSRLRLATRPAEELEALAQAYSRVRSATIEVAFSIGDWSFAALRCATDSTSDIFMIMATHCRADLCGISDMGIFSENDRSIIDTILKLSAFYKGLPTNALNYSEIESGGIEFSLLGSFSVISQSDRPSLLINLERFGSDSPVLFAEDIQQSDEALKFMMEFLSTVRGNIDAETDLEFISSYTTDPESTFTLSDFSNSTETASEILRRKVSYIFLSQFYEQWSGIKLVGKLLDHDIHHYFFYPYEVPDDDIAARVGPVQVMSVIAQGENMKVVSDTNQGFIWGILNSASFLQSLESAFPGS